MTLQSPTATLIPLFSSSELTGCGHPGLLDRKNRSDMCPRWESNPRLPACKGSTLSTRPGSPSFASLFPFYEISSIPHLFSYKTRTYPSKSLHKCKSVLCCSAVKAFLSPKRSQKSKFAFSSKTIPKIKIRLRRRI